MRKAAGAPSVWAAVHALAALGLVAAGSLVNSHQAALSVPDWPLSYGRLLLTSWSGNTVWEQAHRLSAAIVLFLHAALLGALRRHHRRRSPEPMAGPLGELPTRRGRPVGRGLRRLVGLSTALLVTQVLLGGAVVLALDPPWLAALHVLLAQLFAAAAVVLARACAGPPVVPAAPSRLLRALPWLLGLQIALGAVSRHPPAAERTFLVTMIAHSLLGLVLLGLVVAAGIGRLRRGEATRGAVLVILGLAQLGVGLAVFVVAPEPLTETWPPPRGFPALHAAHHLLAALLLGTAARMPNGGLRAETSRGSRGARAAAARSGSARAGARASGPGRSP